MEGASLTGVESDAIRGARAKNPEFPHPSTADQFFDEGQFEAYRKLGDTICRSALEVGALDAHLLPSESGATFGEVKGLVRGVVAQAQDDREVTPRNDLSIAPSSSSRPLYSASVEK